MFVFDVLLFVVCLNSGTINAIEIVNPHDKFKCKLSWDLPVEYTNVTLQGDQNYEYGQYVWEGIKREEEDPAAPVFNPFLKQQDPFPQKHHDLLLDCASGIAIGRAACEESLRPACDSFCEYTCLTKCSAPGTARDLAACLRDNGLDGCFFNVQHTHWLKARACRKEFDSVLFQFPHLEETASTEPDTTTDVTTTDAVLPVADPASESSTPTTTEAVTTTGTGYDNSGGVIPVNVSSMTVFVVEVLNQNVKEVNWKRIVSASLSLALESEFVRDPIAPDFGNLFDVVSGIDMEICDLSLDKVPHSPLDRPDTLIHTAHIGASYFIKESTPNRMVIDSHISPLMSSSALHGSKGHPDQLMIWWPGKQPMFSGGSAYTEEGTYLKVTFQGYPAHYLSTNGFIVLSDFVSPKVVFVSVISIFVFAVLM